MKRSIAICIPCFNERKNLDELYYRIDKVPEDIKEYNFSIIFADNCSEDLLNGLSKFPFTKLFKTNLGNPASFWHLYESAFNTADNDKLINYETFYFKNLDNPYHDLISKDGNSSRANSISSASFCLSISLSSSI